MSKYIVNINSLYIYLEIIIIIPDIISSTICIDSLTMSDGIL